MRIMRVVWVDKVVFCDHIVEQESCIIVALKPSFIHYPYVFYIVLFLKLDYWMVVSTLV